jgi:hypothetical protein
MCLRAPRSRNCSSGKVFFSLLKMYKNSAGPTLSLCGGQRQALCASQGENGESLLCLGHFLPVQGFPKF